MDFYPSTPDRGVRSELALKLAITEMYVQGILARKVTEVLRQLCGLEISSAQVNRCAEVLEAELAQWRQRPRVGISYLVLDAR